MKLYDAPISGNGYKVRLLLSHLGTPYEYVPVDILAGEAGTQSFLEKNPFGKIPVLELDDGRTLSESNAILFWLARGTTYWPTEPMAQAQALRWLFFEQRTHMPTVGGARYWLKIHRAEMTAFEREQLRELQAKGSAALAVLDRELAKRDFLVDDYSIADIALYAYTHMAHEGGYELAPFPSIGKWLTRVKEQPGHATIDQQVRAR